MSSSCRGFMPRRGLCEPVFAWNTVAQMMLKKANGEHTLARPRRAHRLARRRRRRMAAGEWQEGRREGSVRWYIGERAARGGVQGKVSGIMPGG